jgi:hypothetical protein
MTDDYDEAARERFRSFHEAVRRSIEGEIAAEQPARHGYAHARSFDRPVAADAEKPKPGRIDTAPVTDWAEIDNRMGTFVLATVGPCVDKISERVDELLNHQRDALQTLKNQVRELEIRASQQDVAISKRDVAIARQDVAIAELQARLATGDRRGGVIDPSPSMKTIN